VIEFGLNLCNPRELQVEAFGTLFNRLHEGEVLPSRDARFRGRSLFAKIAALNLPRDVD